MYFSYPNWSELPTKATGCGKRCYCEMSNVTCQQMCPPVSETPPINLHCPANQAILAHPPGDECCSVWTCPNMGRTGKLYSSDISFVILHIFLYIIADYELAVKSTAIITITYSSIVNTHLTSYVHADTAFKYNTHSL